MTLIVAHLLRVPIVILEQNAIPGRANILLCRWAALACVQFEMSRQYFKKCNRVEQFGNPVRGSLLGGHRKKGFAGLDRRKKTIVVLGGSQGSSPINEKVVSELGLLERHRDGIQLIHQTGKRDFERVCRAYAHSSVKAKVFAFIEDMGAVYHNADLVIGRSGATTVAELSALGVPALLVPFPHARDNHQYYNAKVLADGGGAVIFEQKNFATRSLIEEALRIVSDGKRLSRMRRAAKKLGKPEAAERIAEEIAGIAALSRSALQHARGQG
jgi:UDP-N-acetylglucosamine--N-acetylmuramyl-(pentapeptide) pyrophosphoryl-undecaprenol N-acetylglucosamine transferase